MSCSCSCLAIWTELVEQKEDHCVAILITIWMMMMTIINLNNLWWFLWEVDHPSNRKNIIANCIALLIGSHSFCPQVGTLKIFWWWSWWWSWYWRWWCWWLCWCWHWWNTQWWKLTFGISLMLLRPSILFVLYVIALRYLNRLSSSSSWPSWPSWPSSSSPSSSSLSSFVDYLLTPALVPSAQLGLHCTWLVKMSLITQMCQDGDYCYYYHYYNHYYYYHIWSHNCIKTLI